MVSVGSDRKAALKDQLQAPAVAQSRELPGMCEAPGSIPSKAIK
jgi:hypothetical protein